MIGAFALIIAIAFTTAISQAQVLEHFKEVDQVLWIVEDLESVKSGWKELGFDQTKDLGTVKADFEIHNKSADVKIAITNLGGANVVWIQPLGDGTIFNEFQRNYRDGAMSLVHRIPELSNMESEIKRLEAIRVEILERFTIKTTEGEFKYVLCCEWRVRMQVHLTILARLHVARKQFISSTSYDFCRIF